VVEVGSAELPDPRVRRSRAALMAAAVRLVSERETTAISVTDLTAAADVTRKLLYQHFGDRDGLLVAAAVDLADRGLVARAALVQDPRARVLVLAEHFSTHRAFYRAMLTGSCAFAITRALTAFFSTITVVTLQDLLPGPDEPTRRDLAVFYAGGVSAITNDWLIDGPDPLDPEDLVHRLLRLARVLAPTAPDGGAHAKDDHV
jgi:AcrR family transcriptional regulator